jgi:hypothetical protein
LKKLTRGLHGLFTRNDTGGIAGLKAEIWKLREIRKELEIVECPPPHVLGKKYIKHRGHRHDNVEEIFYVTTAGHT